MSQKAIFNAIVMTAITLLTGCSQFVSQMVDSQPKVNLKQSDYVDPGKIVSGHPVFYQHKTTQSITDPDLKKYAPVIVQGFQAGDKATRKYNYNADAFGTPVLSANMKSVKIDTQKPVVYSRIEQANISGKTLKQLVYVIWYPERPVGSVDTGNIDGHVLRITLDAAGRPILFEATQTCGCYHGLFASTQMEQWARRLNLKDSEHGAYHLEKAVDGVAPWQIRSLIDVDPDSKPVMYLSAGTHQCKAIQFESSIPEHTQYQHQEYELAPYHSLSKIHTEDGKTGSMFDEAGLVRGAKRWKEEVLMSDLDHPGWPRHLDKMKIHWDKDQWTDTSLFSRYLNIADEVTNPNSMANNQQQVDTAAGNLQPTRNTSGQLEPEYLNRFNNQQPYLLLVSNRYCTGCEEVKTYVITNDKVHSEMASWNFIVIDTSYAEDAQIAARHRVSNTPTIIVYNPSGHEVFRSEDILTINDMLNQLHHAKTILKTHQTSSSTQLTGSN